MLSEFEMLVFYLDVKRALTNSVSAPSPRGWGLPRPGRTPGVTQTHSDGGGVGPPPARAAAAPSSGSVCCLL